MITLPQQSCGAGTGLISVADDDDDDELNRGVSLKII